MKYLLLVISFITVVLLSCNNSNTKPINSVTYPDYIYELMNLSAKYPDSVSLKISLVNALDSLGFYKEAIQQVDSLITTDSLNFGFWNAKAHLQENAKDTFAAIISYKRAIRIYAAPDAMLSLANLYAETKNDSALLLCKAVNNLSADRKYAADCNFIEGVYFARTGNTQKAIELFDECIISQYTYVVAYLEKGFIFYDAKKYKEALDIFILAATVSNAYADAYYWQAKCYEAMANKKEALINYEKALALDNNFVEAKQGMERVKN